MTIINTAHEKVNAFNSKVTDYLEELSEAVDSDTISECITAKWKILAVCELLNRLEVLTDKEYKILAAYYGVR